MPELPEVEVSRRGIMPHLVDQTILSFICRTPKLRWEIPSELKQLEGEVIRRITRRAKYLLIETDRGTAIVHLGMSGSLRVLDHSVVEEKHDHIDLVLKNGKILRYNDPRRFGAWLWCQQGEEHPVLNHLGAEPLTEAFNATYIAQKAKNKRVPIKQFIMDNKMVVGVGNIYASESLFSAKIHPLQPTNLLQFAQWEVLVSEIKRVLQNAITQGGTTLKDFVQVDGKPGYFAQELQVYGKAKQPCPRCGELILSLKIGQRNTFFCEHCQK